MNKRKLTSIFLFIIAFLVIMSPCESEAKDFQVTIPTFKVTLNGQVVDNRYNKYPIVVYKDITYLPLNYYTLQWMGIKTNYYSNKNICFIGTNNRSDSKWKIDTTKVANSSQYNVAMPSYNIAINTIDENEFWMNPKQTYPILHFRGILYLPLTYDIAVEEFDWKYSFDSKNGLCVDSRDANRPILNDTKIGDTSASRNLHRTQYAYGVDAYAGFPVSTLDDNYEFSYKKKGEVEETFSLKKSLINGDYYFNYQIDSRKVLQYGLGIKPSMNGNILSVVCVKYSGASPNYSGENILLKIDMVNQKIISQTAI